MACGLLFAAAPAHAATPAPIPPIVENDFKTPLHAVVTVEVNAKGQVSKIRSMKSSKNEKFNLNVYGNAAQMFIRREDGSSVPGVYDVTYDFNPSAPTNAQITRHVALVQAGGVDPAAPGMVTKYHPQTMASPK